MTNSEHTRKIIHVDMDMFYAVVELLDVLDQLTKDEITRIILFK